jgi:ParB family transcriptional regulator, chromosome partitioning protein
MTTTASESTSVAIDDELPPELPGSYQYVKVDNLIPNPKNIRDDAAAIPGIVANLTEDGPAALISALTVAPVPAEPGQPEPKPQDQRHIIIDGEQRYWSAIDARQKWIQAIVRHDMDGAAATIAMLRQVHRSDPTATQQAKGIQQLALDYGMDDAEIAKQTGYSEPQVKAGRVVAALGPDITARTREAGMDLFQQAALADFTDDDSTINELIAAAKNGPHSYERAKQAAINDREEARLIAARRTDLVEAGITLLDSRPLDWGHPKEKKVDELRDDSGRLTAEAHRICPGHAVYLGTTVYSGGKVPETAYCTDWRKYRHKSNTASGSGPMTDEDKARRKELIANNKAMDAANPVRRQWLSAALSGKTALKGADRFVAAMLTGHASIYADWSTKGRPMLDKLLNPDGKKRTGTGYVPAVASRDRLINLSLASVAAAIEGDIDRQSWRAPKPLHGQWLRFCTDNGYTLDPVEQIILDRTIKPRKTATKKAAAVAPTLDGPDTTAQAEPLPVETLTAESDESGTVVHLPAAHDGGNDQADDMDMAA